jgi:hypothetical protein
VLPCTLPQLLTAAGAAVAITFLGWLIVPGIPPSQAGGDTATYVEMARDPKEVHWAPLAFRGLEPWLAHALGHPLHQELLAFRLLNWGSLMAAALAVYLIARRLGGSHGAGLLGLIGGACLPMWLFYIYVPYLIDPAAMATEGATMLAVISGWFVVVPSLLVLTGLARETVAGYALPIYMWIRHRLVDLSALWRVVWLFAPALVVVWAIRQPMVTTGYQSTLGLMRVGLWTVNRDIVPRPFFWLFYSFAGSLGVWWIFALHGRKVAGRLWWLLVPVFAQCLFGADYSRFLMFAYPVVLTAGAIAVWRHPRRILLLALVAVQSVAVVGDLIRYHGRIALNTLSPSAIVSGILMVLAAVILWWPRRRAVPPQPAPTEQVSETVPV